MGRTHVNTVEGKTTLAERSLAKSQGQRPVPASHGTFLVVGPPGNPHQDAHASILNRMAKGKRTQDYLVQLHRTYGNRYVQRVLALARQEDGQEVAPEVESAIERSRSSGQALEGGLRLQMERAFGADLNAVRVHTGPEAHSLNDAVSSVAFATGRDIFFREGAYNPGSSTGRELLAHELTHVVQQGGAATVQGKMVLGDAGDSYEDEADSVAKQVIATLDADAAWQSGPSLSVESGTVQNECLCGVHTSSGGECEECRQKREASVERPLMRQVERSLRRQDGDNEGVKPANGGGGAAPDPPHLSAPELAGEDFDAAYHNNPPLQVADTRARAVAVLQMLLADRFGLRAMMPQTFRSGIADGQWGGETTAAVRSFQETHGVRPVGGWEAGHKTLLALDRTLAALPVPPVASAAIELKPEVGLEAGPSQVQGDKPYDITVTGHGFVGGTPVLISFEDELSVHAVADASGSFGRSFQAARRSRGVYKVRARSLATEVVADFRVVPPDQPPPTPQMEQAYTFYLREATRMLRDSNFGVPLSPDFEHDHFDTEFWQWESDAKYGRELQLKPGKTPSQAIDALFARLSEWQVDCDYTVQIANLYAERMTYGAAMFNHRQGLKMALRSRESTGMVTRRHYARKGASDPWRIVHDFVPPDSFVFAEGKPLEASTEELVGGAPTGSRVRWTNLLAAPENSFHHENAVKIGSDRYAAAGIDDPITGNEFTRDALEIRMALMTIPRPTRQDIRRTVYIDEVEIFDR